MRRHAGEKEKKKNLLQKWENFSDVEMSKIERNKFE